MTDFDLVIHGGTLVSETSQFRASVGVSNGQISSITSNRIAGVNEIDATDLYVMPGVVDPHVHVRMDNDPNMAPICEDLVEASHSAVVGGVTTMGVYVRSVPSLTIDEALQQAHRAIVTDAITDVFLNVLCHPGDDISTQIETGRIWGIKHFKGMLAYANRGLMLGEEQFLDFLRQVRRVSGVALIHAENGTITAALERDIRTREGVSAASIFRRTSPGLLEAEGIARAITYARVIGVPIIFVHMAAQEAVEMYEHLVRPSERSSIIAETQPHYALMTDKYLDERGARAKVGPPLRAQEDVASVRGAIAEGVINHMSSDHSPRTIQVKEANPSLLDAPYGGINGTQVLLGLTMALCRDLGMSLSDVVRLTASGPSKAYSLYPRKGSLQVGSDADLVIHRGPNSDLNEVKLENMKTRSDFAFYDGIPCAEMPLWVIRGGRVVVDPSGLRLEQDHGAQYISRTPHAALPL